MKTITLLLMKWHLQRTINYSNSLTDSILIGAYNHAIKSYQTTIIFLESELHLHK